MQYEICFVLMGGPSLRVFDFVSIVLHVCLKFFLFLTFQGLSSELLLVDSFPYRC